MNLQNKFAWGVLGVAIFLFVSQGLFLLSANIQTPKPLFHRRTIIFRVDDSFTYEEQEAIAAALMRWEVASNGHFRFSFYTDKVEFGEMWRWKEDGLATIYKATSVVSWKRNVGKIVSQAPEIVGLAMIYPGDIFIFTDNLQYEFLEKVVTHEVGLLLVGPWHSPDPSSVMYGYIHDPRKMMIQSVDVELAKKFCEFFE